MVWLARKMPARQARSLPGTQPRQNFRLRDVNTGTLFTAISTMRWDSSGLSPTRKNQVSPVQDMGKNTTRIIGNLPVVPNDVHRTVRVRNMCDPDIGHVRPVLSTDSEVR